MKVFRGTMGCIGAIYWEVRKYFEGSETIPLHFRFLTFNRPYT